MQRYIRLAVFLTALALGTAPLFAGQPTIEYLDLPPNVSFTLTGACSFNIQEQLLANNEKIITFRNQAGQITFQSITGVNKWRFTNLSTGKTIDINASGPGKFTVQPGSDLVLAQATGRNFFLITNPPSGIPHFALTTGLVVAELDPTTFNITHLISQQGTVQDICALLQ